MWLDILCFMREKYGICNSDVSHVTFKQNIHHFWDIDKMVGDKKMRDI